MTLTKSLHTITAATQVASHVLKTDYHGPWHAPAAESALADRADVLATVALQILGHSYERSDETCNRIWANCRKLLLEKQFGITVRPSARAKVGAAQRA